MTRLEIAARILAAENPIEERDVATDGFSHARMALAWADALLAAEKPAENLAPDPKPLGTDFAQSFDARDWATAFVQHVERNPSIATDVDTMRGWFANAIMRGYDEHAWRRRAEKPAEGAPVVTGGIQFDPEGHAISPTTGKPTHIDPDGWFGFANKERAGVYVESRGLESARQAVRAMRDAGIAAVRGEAAPVITPECCCYTGCNGPGDTATHQHEDDPCPVHRAAPPALLESQAQIEALTEALNAKGADSNASETCPVCVVIAEDGEDNDETWKRSIWRERVKQSQAALAAAREERASAEAVALARHGTISALRADLARVTEERNALLSAAPAPTPADAKETPAAVPGLVFGEPDAFGNRVTPRPDDTVYVLGPSRRWPGEWEWCVSNRIGTCRAKTESEAIAAANAHNAARLAAARQDGPKQGA